MSFKPSPLAFSIALVLNASVQAAPSGPIVISTPSTSKRTLSGEASLQVTASGSITASDKTVALKDATSGAGVVVDNSGQITATAGRAIESSGNTATTRDYRIYNRAGAGISATDDAVRVKDGFDNGSLLLDNAGTIRSTGGGQAVDFDDLRSGVPVTIVNRAGGLIHGDANDGIRPGANATIGNYGEISSGDMIDADAKNDGIDFQDAEGGNVENHGLISGGRHGITTDVGATLVNYADGVLIGRNGSGFGSDGNGTVTNYGRITGAYNGLVPDGDGDGVDIDLIGHIENHGIIEGTGAAGIKDGSPNASEGIAMGGGSIYNAAGALISGASRGILVDDGNGNAGYAAVTLENHGTIEGLASSGVTLVGDFADSVINDGLIHGGNGIALELGGGDDSLALLAGSRFEGLVDGGDGRDLVAFDDARGGSFGQSRGFERLEVRQGAWTLTGAGDFSEGSEVFAGARLTNQGGIAGSLRVDSGASYAGSGSVGGLDVSGTLLANPQQGAAQVTGDLALRSGSTLAYGVEADGSHATLQVDGHATLDGARLALQAGPGNYPWQSGYQVLSANGGVDGRFAEVSSNFAFLTPSLSYGANSVDLQLTRNDVQFADLASSGNGRAAANALQGQGLGTLYDALISSDAGNAGRAVEQLAGAGNANLAAATLAGSQAVGSAMLGALRQLGGGLLVASDDRDTPQLAALGVPSEARNLNDPNAAGRLWLQGIGSHGQLDGEHGSGDLDQNTGGTLLGADWAVDGHWRLGVLGGYSHTDLDGQGGTAGDIDSWHLGTYALRQDGPLALRLGAAYSSHDGESKRRIEFDGFSDRPRGDYDAHGWQAFAEAGYQLGDGRLSAEPYANLGYQYYKRDAYDEKGGAAALHVDEQSQHNVSSTLGVRTAWLASLDNGMSLTPRLGLGWRHTYGDLDSSTRQAFLAGGGAFSVQGTALDRNSLLLDLGLDLGLSARHSIGLAYSGEKGSQAQNHALVAQWQMAF
ncbi:outer membrane autotransporter barrel domain-containing protein [Pseudomonas delhiensis]|uniref:Outer membrane autotransporter barrel domain-containing protein n=1 Tax=Pseudomonas delhiensis TaxID=366289 RepID=A0A239LAY2_9PSED|nr:autotransporter outer membrane beta-barrel domain-containing protein [Pseudomonas delhiensis]SDJ81916.1 outer membrane autotransporter barrel domain-containing protein [Pseudomonas delhiensis]SNT27003.1 outer membrane autotransporter barrel domain-containing protein [Pseudomonas delhiensis]